MDTDLVPVDELSARYDTFYTKIVSENTRLYCYKENTEKRLLLLPPSDERSRENEVEIEFIEWRTEAMLEREKRFSEMPDTTEKHREVVEFEQEYVRSIRSSVN